MEFGDLRPLSAPEGFRERCAAIGVDVSEAELEKLGLYLALLLETNRRFNLTGIRDEAEAWERHVLDGLSVLGFLEGVESLVDVGSGGGVPGLVVAIVKPALQVTLIEATGKKARFLIAAAERLGLKNVKVVDERAETAGRDGRYRERFDAAVARALGPLRVLAELTLPLVKVGGRVLAMKGRSVEKELADCGDALMKLGGGEIGVYEAMPGVDEEAVMVVVEKTERTPREYPRRPGEPKARPL